MARLVKLRIREGSLVDAGANQHAHVSLFKRLSPSGDPMTLEELFKSLGLKTEQVEQINKALKAKVDEEVAKAKAAMKPKKPGNAAEDALDNGDDDEETMMKSLPEPLRKRLEADRAIRTDLEKRLAEETDIRIAKELVEKVQKNFSHITHPVADTAALLKRAYGVNEQFGKDLEKLLAVTEGVSKQATILTKSLGKSTNGASEGSALAKMNAKAQEMVIAKRAPTVQQAFNIVMAEDPALYNEYLAETNH